MSEQKKKALIATIQSTRNSLSRVVDYLNNDDDTSMIEIRGVQCRLNAAMTAIRELKGNVSDFSLRRIFHNDAYLEEFIN